MMCKLCEENGTLFNIMDEEDKELDLWNGVITIEGNTLTVEENITGLFEKINFRIKYCPLCGCEL